MESTQINAEQDVAANQCSICRDDENLMRPDNQIQLSCSHRYHMPCFKSYCKHSLAQSLTMICPYCMKGLAYKDLKKIGLATGILDNPYIRNTLITALMLLVAYIYYSTIFAAARNNYSFQPAR